MKHRADSPDSATPTAHNSQVDTLSAESDFDHVIKKLSDLKPFVAYLEQTKPSEWQVDTVRNSNNTKNCVMGHLVNWAYGKDYKDNLSPIWDWFEEMWATTYMIYPVNDGNAPAWMNHRYNQKTPKARVIAYLKNLIDGKEKTTQDLWQEDKQAALARLEADDAVTDMKPSDSEAK